MPLRANLRVVAVSAMCLAASVAISPGIAAQTATPSGTSPQASSPGNAGSGGAGGASGANRGNAAASGNANAGTGGAAGNTQPSPAAAQPGTATENSATAAGNSAAATGNSTAAAGSAKPGTADSGTPAPAANSRIVIIGVGKSKQRATEDKPLLPIASLGNSLGVRSGTPIHVRLQATSDSASVQNGDTLQATLADPLAGMPAGTPVQLTVVQVSRAGRMVSYGELSIQVITIGGHSILSDTITALGKEGAKDLLDSAPAKGTEAVFEAGQTLVIPAA